MAHVDPNADVYAVKRQNIFFSGVVPSLDGQCVSLVKWFMQEMSDVPNPQAARGHARSVGKTLVAQGHAVEVTYGQRKRGDVICYEFGEYGHTAIQLSGGRVFEQNVNWPGVASKIVAGARVYASRIGSESEPWRQSVHIYRLKTYFEGGLMETFTEGNRVDFNVRTYGADLGFHKDKVSMEFKKAIYEIWQSPDFKSWQYLNSGDFFNHVGRQPTAEEAKQYGFDSSGTGIVTHKNAWYSLQEAGKVGPVGTTPPPPQEYEPYQLPELFVKKK